MKYKDIHNYVVKNVRYNMIVLFEKGNLQCVPTRTQKGKNILLTQPKGIVGVYNTKVEYEDLEEDIDFTLNILTKGDNYA